MESKKLFNYIDNVNITDAQKQRLIIEAEAKPRLSPRKLTAYAFAAAALAIVLGAGAALRINGLPAAQNEEVLPETNAANTRETNAANTRETDAAAPPPVIIGPQLQNITEGFTFTVIEDTFKEQGINIEFGGLKGSYGVYTAQIIISRPDGGFDNQHLRSGDCWELSDGRNIWSEHLNSIDVSEGKIAAAFLLTELDFYKGGKIGKVEIGFNSISNPVNNIRLDGQFRAVVGLDAATPTAKTAVIPEGMTDADDLFVTAISISDTTVWVQYKRLGGSELSELKIPEEPLMGALDKLYARCSDGAYFKLSDKLRETGSRIRIQLVGDNVVAYAPETADKQFLDIDSITELQYVVDDMVFILPFETNE